MARTERGSLACVALIALLPLACEGGASEPADAGEQSREPARGADAAEPSRDFVDAGADDAEVTGAAREAGVSRDAGSSRDASVSRDAGSAAAVPSLFFLDISGGRVLRADPLARTSQPIVTRAGDGPDGIAVDVGRGLLYWTTMGAPERDDGAIMRSDLRGANVTTLLAKGSSFTPKQLQLEAESGFLYWSDREGMRVMRARVDGSGLETLVTTASGDAARADASNWAVGVAVDSAARKIYWTQKGPDDGHRGSIRRAGIDLPTGEDSGRRSDIEVLFAGLPEPVDLALDLAHRQIYWTDRGDNTISRAPLEAPAGSAPDGRDDRTILVRNAGEVIGIALDVAHDTMYFSALEGTVSRAKLDGTGVTTLLRGQGSLTGIVYVELPR